MTLATHQWAATLASVEPRVQQIGRRLLEHARQRPRWWHRLAGADPLLDPLMRDERLRVASLRFVDVLPALHDSAALATHLDEYFRDVQVPWVPPAARRWALRAARGRGPAGPVAWFVRTLAGRMARRFIAGDRIETVQPALRDLHARGMGFTLDLLGEAVVSETEAAGYQQQYMDLLRGLDPLVRRLTDQPLLDRIAGRTAPRLNLSIKVSALYSQIVAVDPHGSAEAIKTRLRPILRDARQRGAFITLDMEHYDTKDITFRVFREVLMEAEFRDWPDAGLAVQAYLRDTPADLAVLIDWARQRGTPVMVRLVRGAYWDYEVVHAQQHGFAIPVWTRKEQTDACYEQCLAMLMAGHPHIETAVATHNVRSLALGIALAEHHGLKPADYEMQMLYGMADELKESLVNEGVRLRVYVPFGELIPGMAYLVRRLLENTASQSFLRMGLLEQADPDELLGAPPPMVDTLPIIPRLQAGGFETMNIAPFVNEPVRRFTDEGERRAFAAALDAVGRRLGQSYPLLIDGKERTTSRPLNSINPAEPAQVIGIAASASREDAGAAIGAAADAFPGWRDASADDRAQILRTAAALMRQRRDELAAWEVFEAGKPWREADADICEAIDFLEYYSREAQRLAMGHRFDVPGETNRYFYEPRGVVVVISPWNFPLAILCGMTSAALAAGNTVVMKPAPQTPIIAAHFARILHEAGLPPGVLNYLPGGDEAGDALVRDRDDRIHRLGPRRHAHQPRRRRGARRPAPPQARHRGAGRQECDRHRLRCGPGRRGAGHRGFRVRLRGTEVQRLLARDYCRSPVRAVPQAPFRGGRQCPHRFADGRRCAAGAGDR
jgi:RHH-type transcriptional regulator, proline utilization regulon repressor / proline dehydrogenase / delta 1-pyrroline-5-carboxylate dehydrogenase